VKVNRVYLLIHRKLDTDRRNDGRNVTNSLILLASITEVNQCRARLVLGWVTDRIRVKFPVRDIYLGMQPATQVNSAWPSLHG